MTAIWDEAFLKQRERDAREMALAEQSDDDWESADLLLEQAISDSVDGFKDCQLPACRRARCCVGNKPVCMPRCAVEPIGAEQELFEEFYAWIQQERQDAAAEHRRPDVIRAMKHRVHEEEIEDQVEDESAPAPACDEAGRSSRSVSDAPSSAPSQPAPQPQLRKPEPPSAPVPVLPAPKAPPPPELRSPPDVEERVNRIWAEYVASPEEFAARHRPGPRIRML